MILPNVIFIHPQRSSGTSIEHSLVGGSNVDDYVKHLTARQIRAMAGEERWHNSFKFGIVRNPFDRFASLYITREGIGKNIHYGATMKEFAESYTPMPWEHGVQCSDYMNEELDLIITYEKRSEGIALANERLAEYGLFIDETVVKRSHGDKRKDFMSYYDEEGEAAVRARFSDDFERWYK